ERATRAAAIFDDHRLPQLLAEPGRHDAGDPGDAAAGDERHDDLHRLIGIVLRRRDAGRERAEQENDPPRPAKESHLHAARLLAMANIGGASVEPRAIA